MQASTRPLTPEMLKHQPDAAPRQEVPAPATWPVAEHMKWLFLLSLVTAFMPTNSEELHPNLQPRQ